MQDNRELRKGREDAKDEPGASGFYYRDMEIYRILVSGWERLLTNFSSLLSGYRLHATWLPVPLQCWPVWGTRRSQDKPSPNIQRRERASRLQAVYRELRKGREDAKDEPGAADFYYGEMEMRRLAATGWERALLTLYWLVSGYALRATRSLAAFAVVVTVFAVLLYLWGFQPASAPDLGGAFVYSVESATVFFRGPGPKQLTEWGRVLQVCLRLLGPALLALTVLAVRGRVKR